MFESWNSKLWEKASGILLWMSHPAWPSMVWQTYSWDYETFGSFFGSKKACEPLHIQMNMHNQKVVVINTTLKLYPGLTSLLELFDLKGKRIFLQSLKKPILANQLTDCFAAKFPSTLPEVCLIRLSLSNGKQILSQNEYWKSTSASGSFEVFNSLEETHLTAKSVKQENGKVTFIISNPTNITAVSLKFNLRDPLTGKLILPANFTDGYFTLLPGEKKVMVADWNNSLVKHPEVIAEGYNIKSQSLLIIK